MKNVSESSIVTNHGNGWRTCIRKYATDSFPHEEANINAVQPVGVQTSTLSLPSSSRRLTALSWPTYAAYINGVQPPLLQASQSVSSASNSSLSRSKWPMAAAVKMSIGTYSSNTSGGKPAGIGSPFPSIFPPLSEMVVARPSDGRSILEITHGEMAANNEGVVKRASV